MTDREKIIKGLQCCSVKGMNTCELQGCPYYPQKYEWNDCISIITKGALALLKEQEDVLEQMSLDNDDLRKCYEELLKEVKNGGCANGNDMA